MDRHIAIDHTSPDRRAPARATPAPYRLQCWPPRSCCWLRHCARAPRRAGQRWSPAMLRLPPRCVPAQGDASRQCWRACTARVSPSAVRALSLGVVGRVAHPSRSHRAPLLQAQSATVSSRRGAALAGAALLLSSVLPGQVRAASSAQPMTRGTHRAHPPPLRTQASAFLGFGEKSGEEVYSEDTQGVISQMRVRARSHLVLCSRASHAAAAPQRPRSRCPRTTPARRTPSRRCAK